MPKVSILIPSRAEKPENLGRTLKSIFENATGEIEVIIGNDGGMPLSIEPYNGVKVINLPEVVGIKSNINILAASATGKYIYKSDAHCSFGKGFDEILQEGMQDDWIVMPRFYVLDGKTWQWQDDRHYDYFYLSCPFTDPRGLRFKAGGHWPQRTAEREVNHDFDIDETPQIHGSGWMMTKDRFFELGGFPLVDYMGHAQEPLWLALRNWLKGGKVMVNKKTWYAHLHQDTRDKGFALGHKNEERTYNIVATHWMADLEPNTKYGIEWFVDKFMPMPTWPDNWKSLWADWKNKNGY